MKQAEVRLLFLPPYSPDLNPIEKLGSNMKCNLRDTAPFCHLLLSRPLKIALYLFTLSSSHSTGAR
ncbi:MAG: transposase [Treponema sp.]|nr:transposase [Treponema sp.]